jgi:hypothetical protein
VTISRQQAQIASPLILWQRHNSESVSAFHLTRGVTYGDCDNFLPIGENNAVTPDLNRGPESGFLLSQEGRRRYPSGHASGFSMLESQTDNTFGNCYNAPVFPSLSQARMRCPGPGSNEEETECSVISAVHTFKYAALPGTFVARFRGANMKACFSAGVPLRSRSNIIKS